MSLAHLSSRLGGKQITWIFNIYVIYLELFELDYCLHFLPWDSSPLPLRNIFTHFPTIFSKSNFTEQIGVTFCSYFVDKKRVSPAMSCQIWSIFFSKCPFFNVYSSWFPCHFEQKCIIFPCFFIETFYHGSDLWTWFWDRNPNPSYGETCFSDSPSCRIFLVGSSRYLGVGFFVFHVGSNIEIRGFEILFEGFFLTQQ